MERWSRIGRRIAAGVVLVACVASAACGGVSTPTTTKTKSAVSPAVPITTLDFTEAQVTSQPPFVAGSFQPLQAGRPVRVWFELTNAVRQQKSLNSTTPACSLRIVRDGSTVAQTVEFKPDSRYGSLADLDNEHLELTFTPPDTQPYKLELEAPKGYKSYKVVVSHPAEN